MGCAMLDSAVIVQYLAVSFRRAQAHTACLRGCGQREAKGCETTRAAEGDGQNTGQAAGQSAGQASGQDTGQDAGQDTGQDTGQAASQSAGQSASEGTRMVGKGPAKSGCQN